MTSSDAATDGCFENSECLLTEITLEMSLYRYNQLNDKIHFNTCLLFTTALLMHNFILPSWQKTIISGYARTSYVYLTTKVKKKKLSSDFIF